MDQKELMAKIMAIQRDPSLTDAEKASRRQQLMAGKWVTPAADANSNGAKGEILATQSRRGAS